MKKILLALSFILFIQSSTFAIEDVKKVFLQEAIDAAIENNIDLEAAYEKFLTTAENLNDYESKILTSSDELIDISIKAYETGKSYLTALIVVKQSYKSILVGHTYALAEYYNSWTNFLREVNDENFKLQITKL